MEIHELFMLGLLFAGGAQGADLETFCTPMTDGKQSTAFATVDGNTVNGTGCTEPLSSVQFHFVDKASNNTVGTESASYHPASGTCNTAWNGNARCVNKTASNIYTYEVRFVPDKSVHSQQYLTVDTDCVPIGSPVSPYSVDYTRCDPIPVTEPTTTATPTTTTTGSVIPPTDIHMVCPGEVWQPGGKIQLECFVQKSSYPSKCVTSNRNKTIFRHSVDGNQYDDYCTVDLLSDCNDMDPCHCETGNTTHYKFVYNFRASEDYEGFWGCSVPCFDGGTPLTFSQHNCQNRRVVANFKDEFLKHKIMAIVFGVFWAVFVIVSGILVWRLMKKNGIPAPDYPGSNDIRSEISTTYTGKGNGQ